MERVSGMVSQLSRESTHADRYSFRQLLPLRKIPVERRFKKQNNTKVAWGLRNECALHKIEPLIKLFL